MAGIKARLIWPAFWLDPKILGLSDPAKLLLIGMITLTDDYGRIELHYPSIRAKLGLAGSYEDIDAWLREILQAGIYRDYPSNGMRFAFCPNWGRYQSPKFVAQSHIPKSPDQDWEPIKRDWRKPKTGQDSTNPPEPEPKPIPPDPPAEKPKIAIVAPPEDHFEDHLPKIRKKPGPKPKTANPWTKKVGDEISRAHLQKHGIPLSEQAQMRRDVSQWLSAGKLPDAIIRAYIDYLEETDKFYRDHSWGKFGRWIKAQQSKRPGVTTISRGYENGDW